MDKLNMQTKNLANEKFEILKELFPNAITESIDEEGKLVRAIDKDVLAQEISNEVVEGRDERYQFTWPEKRKAILNANAPISKTLRPCREESLNFDETENLYIEGDNLEVLKLLQETYLGKVKMIYIDPPYNTGSDFVYNDDFKESTEEYLENSGQFDEDGNRLEKNLESNGRFHTDWLNMIYPRLKLARNLLSDDGIIVISIDDNEDSNLKKCCDEIFGEKNLVNCFIWNCSTAGGIRPKFASKTHEYILVYAKNKSLLNTIFAPLSSDAIKMYTQKDDRGKYRDKDFVFKNKSTNKNQIYGIICPDGKVVYPKEGYIYRYIRSRFDEALENNMVTFKKSKNSPLVDINGVQAEWNVYIKKYLGKATGAPSTLIPKEMMSIYNIGTQTVQNLFEGVRVFENVKPVDVISYLINMLASGSSVVLDFFSGSATTAHAVMQLNAEDGGKRKFIMVQLPEETDEKSEAYKAGYKNICEIGKERIRRAGKKILEDNKDKEGIENLDIGFRVLKADTSNMKDVYYKPGELNQNFLDTLTDNIKEDRRGEDLLFQVMLDLGIPLSSKIETEDIDGKEIFIVDEGYLIASFYRDIDDDLVTKIAKREPAFAVFRDSSMKSDSALNNFDQIFERLSPETTRRVI